MTNRTVLLLGAAAFSAALSDRAPAGNGPIDIELRPMSTSVAVGEQVELGLYLVASGPDQSFAAAEIIIEWPPGRLELLGLDNTGAESLLSSAFPMPDPYMLNEASPPADGDALYVALASFGTPTVASESGTLLTTFRFSAIVESAAASVEIAEQGGSPEGETVVFSGAVPNLDVTGDLRDATIEITGSCIADLDGDGVVNGVDLASVLGDWGPCQ